MVESATELAHLGEVLSMGFDMVFQVLRDSAVAFLVFSYDERISF